MRKKGLLAIILAASLLLSGCSLALPEEDGYADGDPMVGVLVTTQPLELFDPRATWKRKTYTNFEARPLQVQVFKGGQLVYQQPSLQEIQKYCAEQVDTLWDEVKRFENPHKYYVDLSQKLWDIKQELLRQRR